MNFDKSYDFGDKHALLSPSNYHWVNYDQDKVVGMVNRARARAIGTSYHELAKMLITLREKLPKTRRTLPMFVNDAIGYRMKSEQGLYFSEYCYGTADAISFRKGMLRIHDLKTGVTKASMIQLELYAAIFCLEYGIDPETIEIELRIYQNDDFIVHHPQSIRELMDVVIMRNTQVADLMRL
jgi:hypothetical protein